MLRGLPSWVWFALVLLTLVAGMVYGLVVPTITIPYSDEIEYRTLATNLYEGRGYSRATQPPYELTASRVPGYPLFVAAVFKVAGPSLMAVRVAQIGLYLVVVWLTVLIALRAGGFRVGWLAGVLLNLYPFVGYFTGLVLSEMIATVFFLGVTYSCVRASEGTQWRWYLLTGCLGGLCTLVRPQFLPLTGFLMLGALVTCGVSMELIKRAGAAVLVVFLVVAPWTVRNWLTFQKFIPLDTVGLEVFYMGAMATRGYNSSNWHTNPKSKFLLANEGAPEKLYERGLQEIRSDPIGHLQSSALRMIRMWFIVYHPGVSSFYLRLIQGYLLAFYLLAAWGLWVSRRQWRRWFVLLCGVLLFPLTLFPFYVEARYTTAARPIILVFAAIGLISLKEFLATNLTRRCSA